ncbi:MAG: alpha/beta fold hydrolase [Polaromonas sp.]|nr:alpha/beta fold hydrolase [Polaromonas sp.]
MRRRNLFAAASLACALPAAMAASSSSAMAASSSSAAAGARRTFVLVHGAWHGGWCWTRVAGRLRALGHDVHVPTLTGLGERRHLISPQVNLDTHVDDVVNLMEFEELNDVVLVGHSYAGIVISGVADRAPERLRQLVYLDALLLDSGKSIFSSFPKSVIDQRMAVIRESGGGVGAPVALPPAAFGVHDAQDARWVARRMTPQPVGTYLQPLTLQSPLGNGRPKAYIDCTLQPIETLQAGKAQVRSDSGWKVRTLAAAHDAMVTAPGPLTDLLAELAA